MASLGKALRGVLCGQLVVSMLALLTAALPVDDTVQEDFRMPGVQPSVPDTYLCVPRKMGDVAEFLTGFIPHANMTWAHHILLYGCLEPGDSEKVWSCGEMHYAGDKYKQGPVCKQESQILYAWAMDAPQLHLPEDVGFKVGGDTSVKWLVLQVHYKDVTNFIPPKNKKDDSGLTLFKTSTPQPKRAGVYLMGTDGELPPHQTVYMETACSYDDPFEIHPFAFRTHAHQHGVVSSGYRIRDGQWEEIGRTSPQRPQMFYNVTHPGITVRPGDFMAARCTMKSDENRTWFIGSTQNDEMCNFYVMYWVDGDKIMSENYCFSEGPPRWYWSDSKVLQSENAPDSVSIVPGTDEVVKATVKHFKSAREPQEEPQEEPQRELQEEEPSDESEDEFQRLYAELQSQYGQEQGQERDVDEEAYENNPDNEVLRRLAMQQYPQYFQDDENQLDEYNQRMPVY